MKWLTPMNWIRVFYRLFSCKKDKKIIRNALNVLFFSYLLLSFSFRAGAAVVLPEHDGQEQWCHSSASWPQVKSDLPIDPALILGRLDNGFGMSC